MSKLLYNSTLDVDETAVLEEQSLDTLYQWKFVVSKDIININEKYDQNNNPFLIRKETSEEEAALAAHRALYALKRQELFKEFISHRIKSLINTFVKNNNADIASL